MEKKKIKISAIDLYRLLIGECRYGYSRNNHLMPSSAYSEVKKFLQLMLEADPDTALRTAQQLCDECISDQIAMHFPEGLDDEFGNRKEAIEFVKYLLDFVHVNGCESYKPYNYNLFEDNLKKEADLKYTIFEAKNFDFDDFNADILKADKDIIAKDVSKAEADRILFEDVLNVTSGTFNRVSVHPSKYDNKVIGEKMRIISPDSHKGRIYCIVLSNDLEAKEFEKIDFEEI